MQRDLWAMWLTVTAFAWALGIVVAAFFAPFAREPAQRRGRTVAHRLARDVREGW